MCASSQSGEVGGARRHPRPVTLPRVGRTIGRARGVAYGLAGRRLGTGPMTDQSSTLVHRPLPAELGVSRRSASPQVLRSGAPWEIVVSLAAIAAAAVAVWSTLRAGFLAHPGWLALQKADFILGPVVVGLYWRRRRPESRFGLLLIVLGFVGVPYILQSATAPTLFGIGILWEDAIGLMTLVVILAFPNGRLDGPAERILIAAFLLGVVLPGLVLSLTSPQYTPGFSISGCRAVCPANGLAIWSPPSWTPQLADFAQVATIAVALATASLLVWRFVTGTPPRRRSLAIGAPIALLFLLMQATYRTLSLLSAHTDVTITQPVHDVIQWTFAGARSAIWYGFLLALIATELFAARVVRRIVGESLRRPSLRELEAMLRGPLGDPALRLAFWRPDTRSWDNADGEALETPEPSPGRALTEVDRDGRPVVAIVHDDQLSEDPELLQVAGAVALLALENAELEAAWKRSLRELADSRERIVAASDAERRKLERDLHDGAQQRLLAALLNLGLAEERAGDNRELRENLGEAQVQLEAAIEELRELGHGIYPTMLANSGLVGALRSVALRSAATITFTALDVDGFPPAIEAAIYYCCLEAVQNATKHCGPETRISVRLHADMHQVHLDVRDNGPGFDVSAAHDGVGLRNMHDRLAAVNGRVEIASEPGRGTVVKATVPLAPDPGASDDPPLRS